MWTARPPEAEVFLRTPCQLLRERYCLGISPNHNDSVASREDNPPRLFLLLSKRELFAVPRRLAFFPQDFQPADTSPLGNATASASLGFTPWGRNRYSCVSSSHATNLFTYNLRLKVNGPLLSVAVRSFDRTKHQAEDIIPRLRPEKHEFFWQTPRSGR